ncbi:TetR family transcriptional regulator [Pseudonocardia broussonetiae]|uniref:TetR family transcriptional regulator n=1 Tax=Pseudonocardia broussonetiae TaxID=2736640 RepID=A0A6M6JKC3_9PSEU|nr:TetR family transcriptional regulator [Pseudonocardia broussonetiae]QJY47665.1 TetR family transcriptional regulator [Pseudonocardia broussonetiae]
MRDAAATRRRITAAATAEFAAHGIAGARVDRIAAAAEANKAQLYAYFGNKDALFDAVFTAHVGANVDAVPLTVDDLPGYAVRLYDAYLDDPVLVRLLSWARLERTPTGPLFGHVPDHDAELVMRITAAQGMGVLVDDVDPADLWAMLVALAGTWAQGAIVHTARRDDDAAEHERRRAALSATVRRAFCR